MTEHNNEPNITRADIAHGFRVLLRMFGKYRAEMIVFVGLGILSGAGNAVVPYLIGKFVDALTTPTDMYTFMGAAVPLYIAILAVWVFVQVILVLVDRHISRESDGLGLKVWADYLVDGLSHVIRLPMTFHKSHKIGEVSQKISRTGDSIESITSNIIIQLSPQLLSIVIALAITFYISIPLGTFLLGAMVLYVFIFVRSIDPLAGLQRTMHTTVSQAWGDAIDYVSNTRQVKEAAAENEVEKHFDASFRHDLVSIWMRLFRAWGNLYFYQKTVIFFAQLVVFIYAIQSILAGTMTIGELLAINGYAAMIFGPFVVIGRNWQSIQNGIVNIRETEKMLGLPEEVYTPTNAPKITTFDGKVVFDTVSFSYDSTRPILQHISFSVEPGETVAVVGESGVGKTTLVDLLLGYHFATAGRVLIDDHDIRTLNLHMLRSNIAVVSQDIVLFNDTITRNLTFGLKKVSRATLMNAADLADAKSFIEKFPDGWKQMVGERGIKLSGGQRQRVAIARAILAAPSILILDEPTSALDARAEHKLQESLEQVMKGKTTFIIAHRFSTVRNADKIIVLKGGEIVQTGTHEELVREEGEYKNLYDLQIGLRE